MKYYSHPNKNLRDHLIEVRDISIDKVPYSLKAPVEIATICHDFGKYTSYFQEYLKGKNKSDLSNHGFISGIFGAFVTFEKLGDDEYLPLIIYNSILHHHGNLEIFSENLPNKIRISKKTDYPIKLLIKVELAEKQIMDIRKNKDHIIDDFKLFNLDKEFIEFLESDNIIEKTLERLKKQEFKFNRSKNQEKFYFIHQTIYSALISADKISASGITYNGALYSNLNSLEEIRSRKFQGKDSNIINLIRKNIFNEVMDNVEKNYNHSKLFSITAPTGTGKTYTGFFTALKLKELLGLEGKIIYALPFTSIIEQNYYAIIDIFKEIDEYKLSSSRYIIKHHNLSKTDYVVGDQEYAKTQSELLIESWESGVVITTFVQVFETLIGHRNKMLKKFLSFRNSIILIDEIQSIDIEYYNLIEYALERLSEYMNCRIIIMTATQPLILEKSLELLPNNEIYFNKFNRTKIVPKLNKITIEEFVDAFIEKLEEKSYLIVCNTINQSINIYNSLKDLDREVYYLSTNILPFERVNRIKEITNKLKNKDKIVLVSTQVVEAGVDMDFDEVIRDLAPLDSIIQCAGRCNRNYSKEQGKVFVYNMVNEKQEPYGKYIYGNTLLNLTRQLLKKQDFIEEKNYFDLISQYFHYVKKYKSQQKSNEYIESLKILNFTKDDGGINSFSLIKDNPDNQDVLFLFNEEAEETYKNYKEIFEIKNYQEKREKYLELGQILKNYTLSIPSKYCRSFVQDYGILVLPREGIEQFYDEDTGFIRDDKDESLIF